MRKLGAGGRVPGRYPLNEKLLPTGTLSPPSQLDGGGLRKLGVDLRPALPGSNPGTSTKPQYYHKAQVELSTLISLSPSGGGPEAANTAGAYNDTIRFDHCESEEKPVTYNEVMTYVGLAILSAGFILVVLCPLIPGWLAWLSKDDDGEKD